MADRVLVVDDELSLRKVLAATLQREGYEVQVASDGEEALVALDRDGADVVVTDLVMPKMDGLSLLRKVVVSHPDVPVIVVTAHGRVDSAVEAMKAGAFDFVTKPQVKAGEDGFAALREPLSVVIGAFRESRAQRSRPVKSLPKPKQARGKVPVVDVIAIGCSTGGPSALAELIPELPEDLRVPVLIVQHMPARFTASLATSLDRRSKLRVREAEEGRPLRAGEVLVAPGGKHLEVAMQDSEPFVRLTSGGVVNSFRPSVDVLFKSLSVSMPGRALCVVMTGMGADGLEGVKTVRQRGGWCIAQDQASCAVYGMPRSVVESGEADEVVALDQLAARLQEIAKAK